MFDRKSDYALNKLDPDAIVCKSATGQPIRITRADFDSEEEFQRWKTWSDENYHDGEKSDHIYANHSAPLDAAENEAKAVPSPEIVMEQMEDRRYSQEMIEKLKGHLTEKQFCRFWLHHVEGLDVGMIAVQEQKDHSSISKSISAAQGKILIFFQKHTTARP